MKALSKLLQVNRRRLILFLAGDSLILAGAIALAFLLRFDFALPGRYLGALWAYILVSWGVKLPIFYLLGFYRFSWAYVSLRELWVVLKGITYGSLLFAAALFLLREVRLFALFPRSVLFIDYFLALLGVGGFRASRRIWLMLRRRGPVEGERTLIVGAGDAGEQITRAMLQDRRSPYLPLGFVDDDPAKQGLSIHGLRVLGPRRELPRLIRDHNVESLLITMPSAPAAAIRETVELARQAGLAKVKVLPFLSELFTSRVGLGDIRDLRLEDLLGREPVELDTEGIAGYLRGKRVLVTGAAGSIGSELSRQLLRFEPAKLILLDQDETGIYHLENELSERFPRLHQEGCLFPVVGDILDRAKVERLFAAHRPEVVFHAAAYKHVPLMEAHPEEAVKTNIFGTLIVGEAALAHAAEKFILISTDKAVNPTSVMGATKRVAELVCLDLNRRGASTGPTKFVAVRFGNVLGSRGSVVPLFEEQIKRRGPVTVTHPEMRRYFMVTSEAVLLVLQAGALGQGGEVFVLDMGQPIRIVDLARELIRFHGLEPDKDIPIVFTAPRLGEKLFEDLLLAEEGTTATAHRKIFIAKLLPGPTGEQLASYLKELERLAASGSREEIIALLRELVPTYKPAGSA
ncbi:MAG: polysaccharide biosynthesis protein [Candidatus Acetothermia bacterium]|jgi:FlaA1/EpsC-like NDP-sugar epimerase|nr:polysaccharide biosynthesis protein [Candidatus Acetothermia bacterium]MDH7505846.1 nucleoside-diphosphate sugar epimerase/dehydratase [Candidatus Acetothermia bacterium]